MIISSRIAQQYTRQNNTDKANSLFQQTEKLIKLIPASSEKDNLLDIVASNFANSQKNAMILASYVQSPSLRLEIEENISRQSELFALFTH